MRILLTKGTQGPVHPSLSLDSYTSTNPLAKAVCAHQSLQEEQGENEQTRTKMENEERNVSRGKKKWVAKNKQAREKKIATAHERTLANTHVRAEHLHVRRV